MDWIAVLDWTGSAFALTGAALLASQTKLSKYGFAAFLAANFVTATLAWAIHRNGLFCTQLGFTVTSVAGLVRTGLVPVPPRLASASRWFWMRMTTSFAALRR